MELDELPGEGQAEPGALPIFVRRPNLPELLEYGLLILWRDPDPGVRYRDFDHPICWRGPNLNPTPLRREFDRVRQEIQ